MYAPVNACVLPINTCIEDIQMFKNTGDINQINGTVSSFTLIFE